MKEQKEFDRTLVHAVIATIVYYDVLSYPLTAFELWRHLIHRAEEESEQCLWSLADIYDVLERPELTSYITHEKGFYFLPGREELLESRHRRDHISTKKIRLLMHAVRVLRWVPYVRMVALTGRLSYKNGTEESDLDVLIALKDGHIWTGRFLVTAVMQIIGMRRHGRKQTNRVCLNYYLSDRHLTVPTQDLFAAHEYSVIVPLFGFEVFEKFVQANSVWMKTYKPHFMTEVMPSEWTVSDHRGAQLSRRVGEFIFGFRGIEDRLRRVQKNKITRNPNTKKPGACIIATDAHLVFLPKPHGPEVYEQFYKRLKALNITI